MRDLKGHHFLKTGPASVAGAGALMCGFAFSAQIALAKTTQADVIYGDDDRHNIFEPANQANQVEWARSTAMIMYKEQLKIDRDDPLSFRLPEETYGKAMNLCKEEPFFNEPNPAFCSGFLVAPDVFVTAGHCITSEVDCAKTAIVFGFAYNNANDNPIVRPKSEVFYCSEVIAREQGQDIKTDYGVIRLDRKVEGRTPLKYRTTGHIDVDTPLVMIGHPSGLPAKIAGGAKVRTSEKTDPFFVANTDSYGGNSGSAVLNANTGEVEGILVRGEVDFVEKNGCMLSNRCEIDGCRGEDVTRATEFAPYVTSEPQKPTEVETIELPISETPIPDNNLKGLEIELKVDSDRVLHDLAVHVKIKHKYISDLIGTLISPDGQEFSLFRQVVLSSDTLDDTYGVGGHVVVGFRKLRGKPIAGIWKVVIMDSSPGDVGEFIGGDISFTVYQK